MKVKKLIKKLEEFNNEYDVEILMPGFEQWKPYEILESIHSDIVIIGVKKVIKEIGEFDDS